MTDTPDTVPGADPLTSTVSEVNAYLNDHPEDTLRVMRAEFDHGDRRKGVLYGPHQLPVEQYVTVPNVTPGAVTGLGYEPLVAPGTDPADTDSTVSPLDALVAEHVEATGQDPEAVREAVLAALNEPADSDTFDGEAPGEPAETDTASTGESVTPDATLDAQGADGPMTPPGEVPPGLKATDPGAGVH